MNRALQKGILVVANDQVRPVRLAEPTNRKRILLVDDDSDVLVSVGGFIESADLDVVRVSNGVEALEVLASGATIDAVVSDAMMPGMSGMEFLSTARRQRPKLPAMIITGNVQFIDTQPMPFDVAVLRKPFRRREFVLRVQALLQQNAPTSSG